MSAKYADLKPEPAYRTKASARTTTTDRTPRRRRPLASLAADRAATARATSRLVHAAGRTVKPITFNACL